MSRYPHLVALRAAQRADNQKVARSRVRRKASSDPRALFRRAVGFAERQAFGEALDSFEELLAKVPDNVQAHCAQARLLQTLGDHASARAALLSALVVQPEHAQALGLLGRSLVRLGDHRQGQRCFERALALNPRNAEAQCELGEVLLEIGNLSAALERFERSTRLEPGFARAWAAFGACLERLGHLPESRECFERARRLTPSDPCVARAWGRSLLAAGESGNLEARLRDLLSDPRTCSVGLELISSLLAEAGRFDELCDLLGFDTLLQSYDIDRGSGYHDLCEFNEALLTIADAQTEFYATDGVHRSGNLLVRSKGALGDFEHLIADAVAGYIANLPRIEHPFVARHPQQTQLDARALRLPPGTRESATHGPTWLAGVYYAHVPRQSSVTEFGVLDALGRPRPDPKLACHPRSGRLLLYPPFWQRQSHVDSGDDGLVMIELSISASGGTAGALYAPG